MKVTALNFDHPEKVVLRPKNWFFKTRKEPVFTVAVVAYGKLLYLENTTNGVLCELPIKSIAVIKSQPGMILEKYVEKEEV